jgi:hypothetical protein
VNIVEDNENWTILVKIVPRGVSWSFGHLKNYSRPDGRKRLDHPGLKKPAKGWRTSFH